MKTRWTAGISLVLLSLAAWRVPHILADRSAVVRLESLTLLSPDMFDVAIVIARHLERTSEEDPTPLRASRLAIYCKRGDRWKKVSKEFAVRTQSTSIDPPRDSDAYTVWNYCEQEESKYVYGHESVPDGVFQVGSPQGNPNTQNKWMRITDWNSSYIALPNLQVLHRCSAQKNSDGSLTIIQDEEFQAESSLKAECYFHGTITTKWSHRDSFGCLNAWHDDKKLDQSDLVQICAILRDKDAFRKHSCAVLILAQRDKLPDECKITFNRRGERYEAEFLP